ncbi:paramyosin-like [Actinia tenebrosa]|uniref:Paramyosin-like n=1 Tax=Actinia tenebrosa TaxID=6105 RepID=A0A6P8IPV5_ACTTE|nr:paramyosin-like [Actinia tenebrosa]XP_031569091.1 paramyosin-like [Actinia tenebrosa]
MAKSKEAIDLKGKLSRKIAELTMVVHLLFTRNHEREVEIEALKTVYGREIKKIEEEVKGKVSWLEGQLEDFEKARVMLDLKDTEITKHKQQAQLLQERELELKRNLDDKNHLLAFAEKDIIKLREQLFSKASFSTEQSEGLQQLRDEIERLRKTNDELSAKLSSKTQKQKNYQMQIDELQTKVKRLDRELQDALSLKERLEKQLDGRQNDWQGETDRLQAKIAELLECQIEDQDKYSKLEKRSKQFQLLNKELEESNRKLNIQIQQLINDKNRKKEPRKSKTKQETPEVPRCTPAYERDEELERLRKEVQRYRLEISNRESNFNRVFAEQKPIITDGKRRTSMTGSPDHAMFPNLTGARGRMSANGQVSPSHLPSLK